MEIEGKGVAGHVAGGGRYDGLIAALSGGSRDVPAVGAAIHTERLLANSGRC
jgi:ATP phosphoribosyltransferase regulatory subunit